MCYCIFVFRGEKPYPRVCRICHPEHLDDITQMTLEEGDPSDRFVELVDCRHIGLIICLGLDSARIYSGSWDMSSLGSSFSDEYDHWLCEVHML